MKKIVILTGTRAEYGLLFPIIKKLIASKNVDVKVVATGTHLSPEFGMTVREIEKDGIEIDKKIEILLSSDSSVGVSKAMGLALISFSEYFEETKPDALMILGDRYESLAVAIAALNAKIPIIHLHGGEATEGVIDEAIRNSITKLSCLHFSSTEAYRNRIIQMGENPSNVYNVGAVGVENAKHVETLSKDDLEKALDCSLHRYAVLTFHPVTLENQTAEDQVKNLMEAIKEYSNITFICTKANADMNGRVINQCIEEYSNAYRNIKLYDSLGLVKYMSALKGAEFVIGNSSSGLIEVPSFHIPTINIGDRQKGRIQSNTVINCAPKKTEICKAIDRALSSDFRKNIENSDNPYGNGNTSDRVVHITIDYLNNNKLKVQKKFFDL